MHRPKFTVKTLLWLMAVVAAFYSGGRWAERRWAREREELDELAKRAVSEMLKREEEMHWLRVRKNPLVSDPSSPHKPYQH